MNTLFVNLCNSLVEDKEYSKTKIKDKKQRIIFQTFSYKITGFSFLNPNISKSTNSKLYFLNIYADILFSSNINIYLKIFKV